MKIPRRGFAPISTAERPPSNFSGPIRGDLGRKGTHAAPRRRSVIMDGEAVYCGCGKDGLSDFIAPPTSEPNEAFAHPLRAGRASDKRLSNRYKFQVQPMGILVPQPQPPRTGIML